MKTYWVNSADERRSHILDVEASDALDFSARLCCCGYVGKIFPDDEITEADPLFRVCGECTARWRQWPEGRADGLVAQ
jgi:hypothetical protein